MGFYDDVSDAMGRDTGLRRATNTTKDIGATMAAPVVAGAQALGNAGRQAAGNTSFRQRAGTVDAEDAKAYASALPAAAAPAERQPPPQISKTRTRVASPLAPPARPTPPLRR